MKIKVLIVEDNNVLNKNIGFALRKKGYIVESALTYEEAEGWLSKGGIDIVILDIMIKSDNGLNLVHLFKKIGAKVMMLTAVLESKSKIIAYENGADDYITKPFDMYELNYKLRILSEYIIKDKNEILLADILINKQKCFISCNDKVSYLSPSEMVIFLKLFGKSRQNEYLLKEDVFDEEIDISTEKRIKTIFTRLRRHLKNIGTDRLIIENTRGVGYKLIIME